MPRRTTDQLAYAAIRIEGGLIPADELSRLTTLADADRTEQSESHYRIPKGLKLRDEIARYWKIALNLWLDFQRLRSRQDVDAQAVTAREFIVPLLRDVLGFADLDRAPAIEQAGHRYPIGHAALGGRVPLVFAAHDQPLDTPAERFGDPNPDTGKVRRRSPFMLAQEALNASDASLWAVVVNGLRLRILRDNPSLTRPAYLEVDLEAVFSEELYADFTAGWLLAHASRFGAAKGDQPGEPEDCPWERWRAAGHEAGVAIRRNLRYQVTEALRALGTGFLSHPDNAGLRESIQTEGEAGKQAFFEELLRLVYRFIFLATVEDRLDPATGVKLVFAPATPAAIQQRYLAGYSLTWLRERAARRSQHDRHGDLWQALGITFAALARGEPALGLPALGGLFDADQCPRLDGAQLENRWLLAAIFQLGYFRDTTGLSRVNYRDMKFEELGSVYESLLELVPALQGLAHPAHARLAFVGDDSDSDANNRGNTRKLTGSYYTPDSLVQELIRSVLEPVIANTVKANPERPVEALLELTICDPACGSGHFLVAAALRLGDEIALQRAAVERDGGVPTPLDLRHARRDVVSRCLFGIDKNPMAIQLAKTALWLEAYTPDLPLSFIDHHLRVGDALLGVLDPKVLENGIPDEAYGALSGDDKAVASLLKKQNKADLKSWQAIATGDLFTRAGLAAQAVTVDRLADDTAGHVAAKRAAWQQAQGTAQRSILARLADAYVAAFLAPKLTGADAIVPLSGYLWGVLSGQPTNDEVEDTAHALCRKYGVFHWWLAFPQVAAKGGFSVMLGNPPWEQLQLSEEEFFASRAPSIAALAGDKRKQAITSLETDAPWLWSAFQNAKRQYDAANQFLRAGGRFPLTAVGKLNTYALFAEVFLQATRGNGRAGFIVPTGIATDDSTKAYFGHIAAGGRLASLYDFENREAVFPAIDSRIKFSLLTLGAAPEAAFVCFGTRASQLADPRRRFTLTPDEFSLINPNTRTCPVFRSERDAELTKKLYRAAPVLIEEEVRGADGQMLKPELNPWGLTFSQGLFNMTSDSSLFHGEPGSPGVPRRLPLYEAKMIHHFDHRWATYVDADGKPGEVETTDVTLVQKTDPDFTVRPRYWVDEREVLARIARAPARVAKAWLALHAATPRTIDDALSDLLLALASWVAGELFSRAAGESSTDDSWTPQRGLPYIAPTEAQLKARYAPLAQALLGTGLTTKKALVEFPKWAAQNRDVRLSNAELADLADALQTAELAPALLNLLDTWMDARSPRWLMGWRDICRSTDERTVIASVVPRVGVGHTMPLCFSSESARHQAALLGNWCSLTFDYVARQKVGGTHLTYGYLKQLPVLPPDRYSPQALDFIVPGVLELTYTAYDLRAWAEDLGHRSPPFPWSDGKSTERRARLRAELDACYSHIYGLTRDELRYILDPADVMGADYPSETFRVLEEGEIRAYGEYRTRRLVLQAWDEYNMTIPVEMAKC
ncbi:MAG: N-6 DNA methylase [Candidatus Accumulibacter sp.]|uniref:Eco57I restriction-modification methylase domain-containing protein n=2 Tax=Accumulibacter sp. TaxID=2053492 RepID=UPI001AC5BF3F|nr:N-6 DNA methylase [Accumulibacter sp.]MBN8517095.1 N-6 DNA methylase [Accumulibacter sp.]MBO3709312.1 N-6 DNA methylase [Accumulibacter sp.]